MTEVKFALGRKLNYFPKAHWYYAFIGICSSCKAKTLQYLGRDENGHHFIRCQCKACWEVVLKQV